MNSTHVPFATRLSRVFFACLIGLVLGATSALAQSTATGSLTGRVTDATTKLALPGARVAVAGTNLEAFTDRGGYYELDNVPAGDVALNVSYVGYPAKTASGKVSTGVTTKLDVTFGEEVVKMDAFLISTDAIGSARAFNNQRAAPTLTNIISSDAIGTLLDKNVAEALQRVPGVDIARDKGEGRFVIIRGLDPIYLGVSLNGIRAASAEKASRESALDVFPSNLVASMEVTKVTTPDMESDAIGSVNILTHTGLEQQGAYGMFTAGGSYAHQLDRKGGYTTAGNYGDTIMNGKLAFAIGLAADLRKSSTFSEPETTVWSQMTSPTDGLKHWILGGQDFRDYDSLRARQGATISLDYKLTETSKVWVRLLTSAYLERNEQWLTTFNFGGGTVQALTDTTASVTLPSKQILKSMTMIVNNKRSSSAVGGYEGKFGAFTEDLTLGYTAGKYTRPSLQVAFQNTGSTGITYNLSNPYDTVVTQTSGNDISSPASYSLSTKSGYSNTTSNMHEETVRDDLRYDFTAAGLPAYLKFGLEYRNKNNNLDTFKEGITAIPWTLNSGTIYPGNDIRTSVGHFQDFRIREETVESFYQTQSLYTQAMTPATTYGGAFVALEDISSAYLMGGVTYGKLKVMAGSRFEHTHFWIDGWQFDATTNVATPVIYVKNYDNALPSVVLTYEFTPQTIARASWSNTLARPDYQVTAPGRAVNDSARTVTQGNAELPPLTAVNWDASIEHYYSPLGMASLAVYYKTLQNFSYLAQAGTDPATGYLLTTYLTGPSAWVYGLEATWAQRLGFLPAPFNDFGIAASGLIGDSQASYPIRPGEKIPFTGFAKEQANIALTYDHGGFHARVALHYHGKRLESGSTIGTDATQDQYEAAYYTIDAGTSYTFGRHWQVYVNGANLNNAPLKEYYGGTGSLIRLQTYEVYGWSAEGGLRFIY